MFKISCLPLQLAALLANCLWKWRCKELCAAAVKTEACWQKGAASIYILSFDKKQVACPGHVLALACRWVQQHRAPKRDYADRRQLAGWQPGSRAGSWRGRQKASQGNTLSCQLAKWKDASAPHLPPNQKQKLQWRILFLISSDSPNAAKRYKKETTTMNRV